MWGPATVGVWEEEVRTIALGLILMAMASSSKVLATDQTLGRGCQSRMSCGLHPWLMLTDLGELMEPSAGLEGQRQGEYQLSCLGDPLSVWLPQDTEVRGPICT